MRLKTHLQDNVLYNISKKSKHLDLKILAFTLKTHLNNFIKILNSSFYPNIEYLTISCQNIKMFRILPIAKFKK